MHGSLWLAMYTIEVCKGFLSHSVILWQLFLVDLDTDAGMSAWKIKKDEISTSRREKINIPFG